MKKGDWIGIGGSSPRGFGMNAIEVRVCTGDEGWKWMIIPRERYAVLLELLNDNPKYRDAILSLRDDDHG